MNKAMDIIPVREICKWCRKPIRGIGLEHFVCKAVWVTPHEWAYRDSAPINKKIDITDDCESLPLNERCADCIVEYYEGKIQSEEDSYRDDS